MAVIFDRNAVRYGAGGDASPRGVTVYAVAMAVAAVLGHGVFRDSTAPVSHADIGPGVGIAVPAWQFAVLLGILGAIVAVVLWRVKSRRR